MIVIVGSARVRAERREEAVAAAIEMAALSRAEPGCALYEVSVTLEDPCRFRLVEQWDSGEALAAHFATAHFAAFGARLAGFLVAPPSFTRYEVSSSSAL